MAIARSRERKESFADRLIKSERWKLYTNKIIRNGKWKCYKVGKTKLAAYTYEQAAAIEEHQRTTTERLLSELREVFKPLPPLSEEEKKENEKLYWERIQRGIKQFGWDCHRR
jgi:hypothetical protein